VHPAKRTALSHSGTAGALARSPGNDHVSIAPIGPRLIVLPRSNSAATRPQPSFVVEIRRADREERPSKIGHRLGSFRLSSDSADEGSRKGLIWN